MKPDYEHRLEQELERELRQLPLLRAPESLAARVMSQLQQRTRVAWYRQPWQMWPAPLRWLSMGLLLGAFGGLCYACWLLTRAAGVSVAAHELAETCSGANALLQAAGAILGAFVSVIKHLGLGILIPALILIGLGYATCVGVGTACVRLALAHR
jgi:hypothetical protein